MSLKVHDTPSTTSVSAIDAKQQSARDLQLQFLIYLIGIEF
jgi:hypothetical protein